MGTKLLFVEIAGAVFVLLAGSLLHFLYAWCGKNRLVGTFSAVNESTWEHLKMLFFPMLFYSILQYLAGGKEYQNFLPAKVIGILAGLFTIVAIFYTYTGILGTNYLFLDILCFILGVAAAYGVSYFILFNRLLTGAVPQLIAAILGALILTAFLIFTAHPPKIGLFRDPVSDAYGFLG